MVASLPSRHDLLILTPAGAQFMWERRTGLYPDPCAWSGRAGLIKRLPAITRRYPAAGKLVPVGVSLPVRIESARCRMASYVPLHEVREIITPWQAVKKCAEMPCPAGNFIDDLLDASACCDLDVGVFGSAALQAVTGLPYLHGGSDLDLVVRGRWPEKLRRFEVILRQTENRHGIRADVEFDIGNGYYIKLRELLSGGETVLAKGRQTPELLRCCEIWEYLHFHSRDRS